jgi:hypothetical protein
VVAKAIFYQVVQLTEQFKKKQQDFPQGESQKNTTKPAQEIYKQETNYNEHQPPAE